MDDPHSGTKEIRSGGWVTAGQEDLTDDADIVCVAVNSVQVTIELYKLQNVLLQLRQVTLISF